MKDSRFYLGLCVLVLGAIYFWFGWKFGLWSTMLALFVFLSTIFAMSDDLDEMMLENARLQHQLDLYEEEP